jgi:hypothetical protein
MLGGKKRRLLVGLEAEMFLLDEEGKVINKADLLIEKARRVMNNKKDIKKECSTSMVEVGAYPDKNEHKTMTHLINNVEALLLTAEKENISLLPLGTYPGKFQPEMRRTGHHMLKKEIFGEQRFKIAGRVCGFHFHYDLPFNLPLIKNIAPLQFLDVKHEMDIINGYNMMTAMDPALTTFMQATPFYQGKHLAKDSRMLVYRGGKILKYPKGLYGEHQEFGALQGYKYSMFELMDMISGKFEDWKKHIKSVGVNIKTLSLYGSLLATSWNPVKINQIGTLEQRGMDMNHPQHIIATSVLTRTVLKRIYKEDLQVIPCEIGIDEPFKVEGKNLYVPPEDYLRKRLQVLSAFKGMDSPFIHNYCKNLHKLALDSVSNTKRPLLKELGHMIEKKQTVADDILKSARKKGWKNGQNLPQKIATDIALEHSNKFFKEIFLTKKMIDLL